MCVCANLRTGVVVVGDGFEETGAWPFVHIYHTGVLCVN